MHMFILQLKIILKAHTKNIIPSLEKYLLTKPDIPPMCEPSMVKSLQSLILQVYVDYYYY